ncbi:MAG: general secretion pathway protein GspB [Steroidobacteraceae bacterium]
MSFILDALKKSELERQRQAIPGLMESATTQKSRRLPPWAIALVALLGINLVVLLYVLTRTGSPGADSHPARSQHPAAATAAQQPAASGHFSPLDSAPVYAPEIPVDAPISGPTPPGLPMAHETRSDHPITPAANAAPMRSAHQGDPLLTDEDGKVDQEVLPSISEINLTGQQALPELHLDVHVYATRPAERFVYINMRKYREGATLAEGPVLERIRRDGVILDYQGLRFVLPRQQ